MHFQAVDTIDCILSPLELHVNTRSVVSLHEFSISAEYKGISSMREGKSAHARRPHRHARSSLRLKRGITQIF